MDEKDPRKLILSTSRALIGEVSPCLRGVAVEVKENDIVVYFYNDGEITEALHDDYTSIATEISADYKKLDIDEKIIRSDYPQKLPSHDFWVYKRKEAYLGHQNV